MAHSEIAEREWIAHIRAGDVRAFETMFRAYYNDLCRAIAGYVGDRDAAEDIVQNVFVRLWDGHASWDAPQSLSAYLHAVVRRRAVDQLRHEAMRRRVSPMIGQETEIEDPGTETTFAADELRQRFERAVAELPPRTREAFVLSRRDGLSYDEIALRMGISIKTVGVHIGRSLAALRKIMAIVAMMAIESAGRAQMGLQVPGAGETSIASSELSQE